MNEKLYTKTYICSNTSFLWRWNGWCYTLNKRKSDDDKENCYPCFPNTTQTNIDKIIWKRHDVTLSYVRIKSSPLTYYAEIHNSKKISRINFSQITIANIKSNLEINARNENIKIEIFVYFIHPHTKHEHTIYSIRKLYVFLLNIFFT